jgi:hypothetical protein
MNETGSGSVSVGVGGSRACGGYCPGLATIRPFCRVIPLDFLQKSAHLPVGTMKERLARPLHLALTLVLWSQ